MSRNKSRVLLLAAAALVLIIYLLRLDEAGVARAPVLVPSAGQDDVTLAPLANAAGAPPVEVVEPLVAEAVEPDVPIFEAASAPDAARSAPTGPDTWHLAIHVTDELGRAIADASVEVLADASVAFTRADNEAMAELLKGTKDGKPDPMKISAYLTEMSARRAVEPEPLHRTTDADGWCRVSIAARRPRVHVSKDGVGTSGVWSPPLRRSASGGLAVEPTSPPEGEHRLTLVLRPQAEIAGTVLDQQGLPLAGAAITVSTFDYGRGETEARAPPPVTSDAEGHFSFPIDAPTTAHVSASFEDATAEEATVFAKSSRSYEVTLRMTGAYSISGVVLGPDDEPVARASVRVERSVMDDKRVDAGEDGRFTALLASPGGYLLVAQSTGLVQLEPLVIELTEAAPTAEITLRLASGASVSGTVRWATGEPVAVAMVSARPQVESDDLSAQRFYSKLGGFSRSKTDGSFELTGLHPGLTYNLRASGGAPTRTSSSLDGVAPGTTGVEIVLEPEVAQGCTVTGTVIDEATGSPIEDFAVSYGYWIRGLSSVSGTVQVSDPAGRFRLEHLKSSQRALRVVAEGYPPKTVGPLDLDSGTTEVVIELGRLASMTVATVDESGKPISGAYCLASRAASEEQPDLFTDASARTSDVHGACRWEELPPGRYLLQAVGPERLSDLEFVEVTGGLEHAFTVELREHLDLGSLVVTVREQDGQPIAGAKVSLNNMTGLGLGVGPGAHAKKESQAETDAAGSATFSDVLPGEYWVWPNIDGTFISPRWVAVPGGQETIVEMGPGG